MFQGCSVSWGIKLGWRKIEYQIGEDWKDWWEVRFMIEAEVDKIEERLKRFMEIEYQVGERLIGFNVSPVVSTVAVNCHCLLFFNC